VGYQGILELPVLSGKTDNTVWKKLEEILFRPVQ
jgi:hypothetical protein